MTSEKSNGCWAPTLPDATGVPWTEFAHDRVRAEARGSLQVDVAIVGGGLTGLTTALYLKQWAPALRVAVLEATRVGAGASGRGTGLLGPRVGPQIGVARSRYGDSTAAAMYRASEQAVRDALQLISEHRIECGLTRTAQLIAARTGRDAEALEGQARAYEQLGIDVPLLSGRALRRVLAGSYRAALRYSVAATLDPGPLTAGIAQRAEQLGVCIYEHSPVAGIRPGRRPQLDLPAATVRATHVVVATNAFPSSPPALKRAVMPLEVHALATAPLAPAVLEQLGCGAGAAIIEHGTLAPYFRLTADRRIVLGGGAVQYPLGTRSQRREATSQLAWRQQERWLRALHPALREVTVTHRWSGHIGLTRDGVPIVGPSSSQPGVWYAGGWCGHGLAMGVRTGRQLAAALLGEPVSDARLPWWRGEAPRVPDGELWRLVARAGLDLLGKRAALTVGPRNSRDDGALRRNRSAENAPSTEVHDAARDSGGGTAFELA